MSQLPASLEIRPLNRPIDAVISVPGSKSITNRALLLAALAEGESVLENALFSEDSQWCSQALQRLGICVQSEPEAARFVVNGKGGYFPAAYADLFVGNSGTTARFLVAAATLGGGTYRFDGVPRMRQRPIRPLLAALRQLGAHFSFEGETDAFPLMVHAVGLNGGTATLEATDSSQYVSALLQVAPYARRDVSLTLTGEVVSEPYIEMTLRMMAQFGVIVDKKDYRNYRVCAGQRYRAQRYVIEPDASNATYFFAAAALIGGRVRVPYLSADSLQGDARFVDVLERMGCQVERAANYLEVRSSGQLRGVDVDLNAMSDTAQTLAAIAPFASSPTHIRNIGHIRHKETDRIAAVATELRKLGAQVEESADALTIYPSVLQPTEIETYDDHRMAMAFSVTGLALGGVRIKNPSCTAKTFPDYFKRFEALYG
ncbi:MAG: 3-phosphoshikimate 1-carboxyvinyltransferase [Chloroflexota bacterium]|jgi:3-phosphoshikimate 1-carboxyvinyltransferase|uniref:3-phosphoshikimate 1-carboxyvinyltransferase n=3 Tax=Candidatus Thermofonsia Clade 1 bacterium TaxID=2364210 RepID=A0A2M8PYX2_9CHLR|nr:MAG: 3-phosphoshikimate 1-carboxyvinyltransferase [Candidatus Thermofonsia Clade 1 bacterium]RMF52546.1 MAG: 3-phosphoshikimate 1-carboxyvinyltransferase [Chloroflexota bacterium]